MAPGIHRYTSDADSPKINPKSFGLQAQSLAWENQMAYRVYRQITVMPYCDDRRQTLTTTPSTEMLKTTRAPVPIENIATIVSTEVALPLWVYTFIGTAIGLLTLCSYICFIRQCCRKRRAKDTKKGKGIVDFKSVQYLGCAKVQFDTELLTENAEDIAEEGDSKQSEVKLGKLQYKLEYDFNSNSLTVTVIQAEGLPTLNMSGTSNFYVKVYLLPDKKKKFEAKGRSKTVNPIFNETFTYKDVPYADVMNKTLVFAIIYLNRFSKQKQIGEVKVPLCQVDLAQTIEGWKEVHNV